MPQWENDPLSSFLADAARNERVSSLNFPDIFAQVQRTHSALKSLAEITENNRDIALVVPRILMARASAAFLAATRLGLAGHTVEAHMVLRGVIEASWYAIHIAMDPNPPSRVHVWLRRGENDDTRRLCRREFHPDKVEPTYRTADPVTAAVLEKLYDGMIEWGAHPNEQGILAAITSNVTSGGLVLNVHLLSNSPVLIKVALKRTIEVGIGILKTFGLIFPERVRLTGLDSEVERLIASTNALFSDARPAEPEADTIWLPHRPNDANRSD